MFLSILLICALVLAACGKSNNEPAKGDDKGTEQGQPSTPATNDPATPAEPEAPAELGFIKATDPSKIPTASKNRGVDTMIIGMNKTNGLYNPFFYDTSYDAYVWQNVIEALAKSSQDGKIVPDLATWETSEDGLVWTFHIDPKATFSDGTPVTAEDAEFSFYVYLDPTYDGRTNMTVPKIKGADAYKNGDATTIEGIKVINEKTLEVTVDEVNALTLSYLTVSVVPKHYYGEGFSKGNLAGVKAKQSTPLGSGPYKFVKDVPAQEVQLVANENYWNGQPKVKNLIFKATTQETYIQLLETGETDFEEGISVNKDNIELLESMGFLDLSLLLNNGYGYIALNHNNPKFADKRVRQALTYGLDRESVVYAYSQGYANVIDVPQSSLSWAYPDTSKVTQYNYNPEKAAQLLDEAGWVLGADGFRYKDGEKFTIQFSASSPNAVNDALIPIAVENYKDLGIEFIAEQLEFNAVVEKRNAGEHEMAFLAVSLAKTDPDPFGLFHTNGGSNKDFYSNPKVDELIEAGQKELNQDKRKEIYNELYQILNEEIPVILMYQRYNMNTINTRLQGWDITPYYDFWNSLPNVEVVQ